MSTQPIDYAALAEQARQQAAPKVDYAALAAQARQGSAPAGPSHPVQPSMSAGTQTYDQAHPTPKPGIIARFASGAGIPTSQYETSQAVQGMLAPKADAAEQDKLVRFEEQIPLLGGDFRARAALSKRADNETGALGIAHRIASYVPLVGPAVAATQDKVDQGDYAGAAGAGINALLSMEGLRAGLTPKPITPEVMRPSSDTSINQPSLAPKGGGTYTGPPIARPVVADVVEGLRKTASDALDTSAKADLGKVLAPTKQATKFISKEKVIPGMQERGIVAGSSSGLQERAAGNMETFGQKIDDAYDAMPVQPSIPTKPIIDKLEAYKKRFVNEVPALGDQPAKSVVLDQAAIDRINSVQDLVAQHGEALDPQTIRSLRQHFDENVAAGKGYAGKTMAEGHSLEVQKQAANAIRGQLADTVPGLSDLNSEFSFWKNLNDVLEETAQRRTGQQGGGLSRRIATGTGAVVGAAAGHAFGGGVIGAEAGALLGAGTTNLISRVVNSTSWNTVKASLKTKLANAIATRDPVALKSTLNEIQGAPAARSADTPGGAPPQPTPQAAPIVIRGQQRSIGIAAAPIEAQSSPAEPGVKPAPIARPNQQGAAPVPIKTSEPPQGAPAAQQIERRQNIAQRKLVSEMSPEERAKSLLTSDTVDLPNKRAFAEAEQSGKSPAVAMSDADGLKAFNDRFGYDAGSELLKAKAEALKEAGLDAYHDKGDEFLGRGESESELKQKYEKAREILRNREIEVTQNDGTVRIFKGADFSYGTGKDLAAAEKGLKANKAEREASGERARGELRGIVEVRPKAGQENTSAAEAPRPIARPPKQ